MGILLWITIGLMVSVLTLMTEPYLNIHHIPLTLILGIIGGLVGGAIGSVFGFDTITGMHFMIVILAVGGSTFLLTWYRAVAH